MALYKCCIIIIAASSYYCILKYIHIPFPKGWVNENISSATFKYAVSWHETNVLLIFHPRCPITVNKNSTEEEGGCKETAGPLTGGPCPLPLRTAPADRVPDTLHAVQLRWDHKTASSALQDCCILLQCGSNLPAQISFVRHGLDQSAWWIRTHPRWGISGRPSGTRMLLSSALSATIKRYSVQTGPDFSELWCRSYTEVSSIFQCKTHYCHRVSLSFLPLSVPEKNIWT